jgi:hypothetical protein
MNEAAAASKADAVEFRLRHTTDERLIAILKLWRTRQDGRSGRHQIQMPAPKGTIVEQAAVFASW